MRGLIPEIAAFWLPYLQAAADRGEIHPETDCGEAAEWIARIMMSLATVPGDRCDVNDHEPVLRHVRRYIVAGLRCDPAGWPGYPAAGTPVGRPVSSRSRPYRTAVAKPPRRQGIQHIAYGFDRAAQHPDPAISARLATLEVTKRAEFT